MKCAICGKREAEQYVKVQQYELIAKAHACPVCVFILKDTIAPGQTVTDLTKEEFDQLAETTSEHRGN